MSFPPHTLEQLIEHSLQRLEPASVSIQDDSALHEGHEGAKGGGHFKLTVVAACFSGRSKLARHRMVYEALGPLMRGRIHALAIHALTPDEI